MAQAEGFDSIPDTISAFRNGEFIVVMDDPGRENEGDLIVAAENITTEQMAFLIRHSSGIVCAPMLPTRADRLALPLMVTKSEDLRGTAYTLTIDAADPSVTTGISAGDRALACRRLAQDYAALEAVVKENQTQTNGANGAANGAPKATSAAAFRRPGHILPLRARPGGVRERRGHTEAGVDFCRLAGKPRVAVISELVDDGTEVPGQALRSNPGMLRGDGCINFARKWGLKVCTISDLATYLEKTHPDGNTPFLGPVEDEA